MTTRREQLAFVAGAVAVAVVAVCGHFILNARQTPWTVTTSIEGPHPVITVSCKRFAIPETKVAFQFGETNDWSTADSEVRTNETNRFVFGKVVHVDLTSEPDEVLLYCFGRSLLLTREALVLDDTRYPWRSGHAIIIGSRKQR